MPNHKYDLSRDRQLGQVTWYGGYDRYTHREKKYGFINSADIGSVHVGEAHLNFPPEEMIKDRWITFTVRKASKGPSAVDVKLAENESNGSVISKILNTKKIPLDVRVKACFNIPLNKNYELISLIKETLEEYNNQSRYSVSNFPDSWRNAHPKSTLYNVLPMQIRNEKFNRKYAGLKESIEVLSERVLAVLRSTDIYESMSYQDKKLALSWVSVRSDFEKAKMLSARAAELATSEFFTELGGTVLDIAISQLSNNSNNWQTHDLLIDSTWPVDVKNARMPIHSKVFVEYTVKSFKKDNKGRDVEIAGVLSPYLTLDKIEGGRRSGNLNIIILGTTNKHNVRDLEKEFSKRKLRVYFGESSRWPIWIYNIQLGWFSIQREAIEKSSYLIDKVDPLDWRDCKEMGIPVFIICGKDVPDFFQKDILPWQKWYLIKLLEKSRSGGLTLPWLYLFTFQHFLEAITKIDSAEAKGYNPEGYGSIIFLKGFRNSRPASLIDPLGVLTQLISTLTILWRNRYSCKLGILREFVLQGEGLLRGIDPEGRKVSVLAYCGGMIPNRGKCGKSPLIIGEQETCIVCRMLICDRCGHCSDQCKKEKGFIRF